MVKSSRVAQIFLATVSLLAKPVRGVNPPNVHCVTYMVRNKQSFNDRFRGCSNVFCDWGT